jgi:hypothetical protein
MSSFLAKGKDNRMSKKIVTQSSFSNSLVLYSLFNRLNYKQKYMNKLFQLLLIFCLAGIISCHKSDVPVPESNNDYHNVNAFNGSSWKTYTAKTIDRFTGFSFTKDPEINSYGSWKVNQSSATGFFRVEKKGNRWWIVDPEGYPFIHKGIAVFRPGTSDKQKAALTSKYGTKENWVKKESQFLRSNGFNGVGNWSDVDLVRQTDTALVYTVTVSPMADYRTEHIKKYNGKYDVAGWQGYRYNLVMVFDPEFDAFVESSIAPIAKYANDKHLLGYFTDNELPWINDALDQNLKYGGVYGYTAAREWLDQRRGKNSTLADINDLDRLAFTGFYFETYVKKVAAAIRKYDPNHMYLGCRFNQEQEELQNSAMFSVAGKYMDIISINHYRKWEPVQLSMSCWSDWSGKPFLVTEWYTKGVDSGLPNKSGAGWIVPTQADRGYFYQNFTIELLKSKACVGWHWFTYQDNDPLATNVDASNLDSNKGIVTSDYQPYLPLLDNMKMLNSHVYELIQFLDKN